MWLMMVLMEKGDAVFVNVCKVVVVVTLAICPPYSTNISLYIGVAALIFCIISGATKLHRSLSMDLSKSSIDLINAIAFYQNIESDSIVCNHNEIEEFVKFYKNQKVKQFEQDVKHSSFDKVTLSLLTSRGDVGYGSGINWGIRRNGTKREPNQAYIGVPVQVAKSGFFPLEKTHFSAITDDNKQLILRIEQANNKALTTPLNNSLLGEYLRNRIGVPNGAFVTKEDLERYGRTDVTFYKIDEEQFFMDFSV